MSSTSKIVVGMSSIAIGLGVPIVCLYFVVNYGFDYWVAGAVAFIAVLIGGAIMIVGITTGPLGEMDDSGDVDRERLRVYRSQQRASLVEMDGMIKVLEEIRDALKSVED